MVGVRHAGGEGVKMARTKYAVEYTDRLQRAVDTVLSNPNFSSYVPSRRPGRNTFTGRSTPVTSGSEYSGEFAVRIVESETAEDGSLASLTIEVRNGFEYYSGGASVPGRILVSGRIIGMGGYLKQTLSASDYDLDNLYVWHKINLENWSGDSALPTSYVFTNSFETPKEENDSSYDSNYYTLLAVIRGSVVYQIHFGPIVITDRYFDESELEGN